MFRSEFDELEKGEAAETDKTAGATMPLPLDDVDWFERIVLPAGIRSEEEEDKEDGSGSDRTDDADDEEGRLVDGICGRGADITEIFSCGCLGSSLCCV